MSLKIVLALMLLVIAGCADPKNTSPPPQGTDTPSDSSSSSSPTTPPGNGTNSSKQSQQLILDACTEGLVTQTYISKKLTPPPRPPGWDSTEYPVAEYSIIMFRCERVSIGPFERGPLHFLMESHSDSMAPEECDNEEIDQIVIRIWIDDQEIVDYLKTRFAVNAEFALVSSVQEMGPLIHSKWTFGLPGGEQSSLETSVPPPSQTGIRTWRYYWVNHAGGISYMDFAEISDSDVGPRTVIGDLRAPFLYAESGLNAYEGSGTRVVNTHVSAPISQFSDLQCKEPL